MSAATRLGGFVALIAVLFATAYLVGSLLGPLSAVHGGSGGTGGSGGGTGGGMHGMSMGAGAPGAAR
jgi:hypothetical protein